MAIRYYYIDDDPMQTIQETAKGLSTSSTKLKITPFQHQPWKEELDFLVEEQDQFDGLILDWSLKNKNNSGDEPDFDVEALAQQLRKLMTERKHIKKNFPIVLCSAHHRFQKLFGKLLSSHDLFDIVYEKDQFNDNHHQVILELTELAKGYQIISQKISDLSAVKANESILNAPDKSLIDYRIWDYLLILITEEKPPYEIARFIINKLIRTNGPLIDEYLLASRLGVDILSKPKSDDWAKLLKKITTFKYNGPFNIAWERWWMSGIFDWWENTFGCALGTLSGPEKIAQLNQKFKLQLSPAIKTAKSKSDYFWVVCKETLAPISIDDAFLLSPSIDKTPWEDDSYISIDTALLYSGQVHPLERERLKKMKSMYTKTRYKK